MNLLFRVLFANGCRSTHHKLAMDALCHLQCVRADRWRNLLLSEHAAYLEGAKAPDAVFKDFRNHVLHVGDHFWGGAPETAAKWYRLTVDALRKKDWKTAAYNAGVLSHYYTDPFMPFHTAQSEAENNIHRAAEWSITKSYDTLRTILESRFGYPTVVAPDRPDWLQEMVRDGARHSNPSYETLIAHYNFARGVKDPPKGLDDVSRELLARLIGLAMVGFARILERAFAESGVEPPQVSLTLQSFLATIQIPIKWITNKMADAKERAVVEAMFQEFATTGRVEKTLPEDDRSVRELHQREVVEARTPTVTNPTPTPLAPPAPVAMPTPVAAPVVPTVSAPVTIPMPISKEPALKFYLQPGDPVGESPSVGPKTEARLNAVGVKTVADLVARNASELATALGARHITAAIVADWQDQARLICRIPQIRGHDAQILIACGYRTPEAVAAASATALLAEAEAYAAGTEGQRILRGSKPPDRDEVNDWIRWANQSRAWASKAAA